MSKKKSGARTPTLCEPGVGQVLGLKERRINRIMRNSGVTEQLALKQARKWKAHPDQAPAWFTALLTEAAVAAAQQQARDEVQELERQHREVLLTEKVERRLLAGARHFRNPDAEFIASDMAFRAMKELVRCDGDTEMLLPIDLAALRWAGVDPTDRRTWFLANGSREEGPEHG